MKIQEGAKTSAGFGFDFAATSGRIFVRRPAFVLAGDPMQSLGLRELLEAAALAVQDPRSRGVGWGGGGAVGGVPVNLRGGEGKGEGGGGEGSRSISCAFVAPWRLPNLEKSKMSKALIPGPCVSCRGNGET